MEKNTFNTKEEVTPTVGEFFSGKTVLVTGASGFLGKVLVEKLLRCCPLMTRIYIILRSRNRKSPAQRWNDITTQPMFDKLKEENPKALEKVSIIEGDVMKKGLDISNSDRKILEDEVAVVFHSAASVRFNDAITDAVFLNTRGSLEMIHLAKKMKKLTCFVYVSTAYTNSNLKVPEIKEMVYPSDYNYKSMIQLAEKEDPASLTLITPKILGNHPNTYTFSKYLAEQIMLEYAKELPIVVLRPSVVINAIKEPVPGWVDNFNGINGILAGITKGLIRIFLARGSCSLDYVAVDYAINSLIVSAWHKSVFTEKSNTELAVYNCAYRNIRKATFNDLVNYGMDIAKEYPHNDILWYPSISLTTSSLLFTIMFFIFQLIPAAIADAHLYLTGSKPILVKLNKKIYIASYALRIFSSESFVFSNKNLLSLFQTLSENDKNIFYMNPPEELTIQRIIMIGHIGMKKYLFKNENSDSSYNLKRLNRLYWIDKFVRYTISCLFIWMLYSFAMIAFRVYLKKSVQFNNA